MKKRKLVVELNVASIMYVHSVHTWRELFTRIHLSNLKD